MTKTDYSQMLIDVIRKTRLAAGLTQESFASVLGTGVSRDNIASYETGRAAPPPWVIFRVFEIYYPWVFVYLNHNIGQIQNKVNAKRQDSAAPAGASANH